MLVKGTKGALRILLLLAALMVVQPVHASGLTSVEPVAQGPVADQSPNADANGCAQIGGNYPFVSVDPDCLGPIPPRSPDSAATGCQILYVGGGPPFYSLDLDCLDSSQTASNCEVIYIGGDYPFVSPNLDCLPIPVPSSDPAESFIDPHCQMLYVGGGPPFAFPNLDCLDGSP